jgi:anthranilate synthase component 1
MPEPLRIQPDEQAVTAMRGEWPLVPIWAEMPVGAATLLETFEAVAGTGYGVLLESLDIAGRSGPYTIVAGDPAAVVVIDQKGARLEERRRPLPLPQDWAGIPGDTAGSLKQLAHDLRAPGVPDLPTLSGGLVGMLAYEAAALLDNHAVPYGRGRPPCPPILLLLMDRVAVFDHRLGRLCLVAHVQPEDGYEAGAEAIQQMAQRILATPAGPKNGAVPTEGALAVAPNVSGEMFRASVRRAREHIAAGDIYQTVLSRRLSAPAFQSGLALYRRLRQTNPSPAMFFLRLPGVELAGSSPEPLVKVAGSAVLTRPIAGTRPRGEDEADDQRLGAELLADPKERAEHAMLVDLARNDLGRVCRPGTVRPTQLMEVQNFPRVMHLVSTVEGELADGMTSLDALIATFPAGTVTGAPKRRAMEIIAAEEPTARGPYAGAVGYLAFAGDLDFCITIRTAVVTGGQVHVQAGAGIVADSDPQRELHETEAKASAILAAVAGGEEP